LNIKNGGTERKVTSRL